MQVRVLPLTQPDPAVPGDISNDTILKQTNNGKQMNDEFKDADRFGCEECPVNPENREYLQQRGVSVSGVEGRPKGNPVLEAIDDAVQPENSGITTERHNEMIDDIRAAYLQRHPQGPEVAGITTNYYACRNCGEPIDMTGTGLEGLGVPGDGEEFERAIAILYPDGDYHGAIHRITDAHNSDIAAIRGELNVSRVANESLRKRIAELNAQLAAAQKPRVMKRWGVDGLPEEESQYWIRVNSVTRIDMLSDYMIESGIYYDEWDRGKITHWLELEPTPTLPGTSGDMSSLVGDGDA